MFTDTNLTVGTEYFYYIIAVQSGGSGAEGSNEDSVIPDASAVPWDTANPSQIVAAVNATAANDLEPDDDGSGGTIPANKWGFL